MNFIKGFSVFLLAVGILAIFYFLPMLGPGQKAGYDNVYVNPEIESSALLKESEELETAFEKAASVNATSEENLAKLRRAIYLQELYIDRARTLDRSPSNRLIKLQTRLHNIEAQPLASIVEELQKKAIASFEAGDIPRATDFYKQAYDIQSRINADFAFSKYKDIRKIAEFDRQIKMLQARPLYLKSIEAEKTARNALKKGDWKTAQSEFEKTIQVLTQLNSEYPTSVYTDFSRLQKLDIDLDSLKSEELNAKVEEFVKKADAALAANNHLLASEAYADALEHQKKLNKLYPKSIHSSEEKLIEFDKKKVDAFSWKFAKEILEQEDSLNKAIFKGEMPQVSEISTNLLRKTEQFKRDFPKSQLIDNDLILRLRYINFMLRDIPKIQNLVLKNLLQIKGVEDYKMLKTEVSQELFSLVMQENPSRYSDDLQKPVDSVTYEEVERFCNRLSWILGRKVELPSREIFKKAIGSLRYADLNEIAWSSINSNGSTHKVASKKPTDNGFYDLLGNVSEFVLVPRSESSSGIKIIGGNSQTSSDTMMDIPESFVEEKQRNRMIGFRIIVKTK